MAVDVPVVIIVVPPLSFGRLSVRGGGEGRAGREIGVDENFFPAFPFPVPHSPFPAKIGDTIANKIKGLRGF